MADRARDRVRWMGALVGFCNRMGWGWVAFRVRYAIERRVGITRRSSPITPWSGVAPAPRPPFAMIDRASLRDHLATGNWTLDELQEIHAELRERRFRFFGSTHDLPRWNVDPRSGQAYRSDHWSRSASLPGVDVKYVWEPNRFAWAYPLARLHLLSPDDGAADTFWELLADWMEQNPPNVGVNWACGQEAAIRLEAVVLCSEAMDDTSTAERKALVGRLVTATGDRIASNMDYAISQRNNHAASEATGLLLSALWTGDQRHRRLARKTLRWVIDTLVFEDGGTSQYSTIYHRVFFHQLFLAWLLLERAGQPPVAGLADALTRMAEYVDALQPPGHATAPVIGADDGANTLPLTRAEHRDLRCILALANALPEGPHFTPEGCAEEALKWFGLGASSGGEAFPRDAPEDGVTCFPAMGTAVVNCAEWLAVCRAGPLRFRPTVDDQLAVTVRYRGDDCIPAPGTHGYGMPREAPVLNTPRYEPRRNAVHLGPFARWPWTEGEFVSQETADGTVSLRCAADGIVRTITASDTTLAIEDHAPGRLVTTRWAMSAVATSCALHAEPDEPVEVALHYGRVEPRPSATSSGHETSSLVLDAERCRAIVRSGCAPHEVA